MPGFLGQQPELLGLVATAKAGGGIDALYPGRDPRQAPWYLEAAVAHALAVIAWFGLPEDDRPPERIWLDEERLARHFRTVRSRHMKKRNGGADDSDDGGVENDLTKGMGG